MRAKSKAHQLLDRRSGIIELSYAIPSLQELCTGEAGFSSELCGGEAGDVERSYVKAGGEDVARAKAVLFELGRREASL